MITNQYLISLDPLSVEKGNAVRLLFPQLYRVRKLMTPLWITHGKESQ